MPKDGKSFLDYFKKSPAAVEVQEAGVAPVAAAPESHPTKRKRGRFSSIFGLKSKPKKPVTDGSTASNLAPGAAAPQAVPQKDAKPTRDAAPLKDADTAADPNSSTAPEHETKDGGASSADPAGDLDPWSKAYAELKAHASTKDLVATCEKILTCRANEANNGEGHVPEDIPLDTPNEFSTLSEAESVDKLSVILQPVLDSYQKETWWGNALEGADMVISKIGKGVGDALQAFQPAAFAWSAICLTVPILVQPLKEQKKVATGLEYVIERMDWFIALSEAVMKHYRPDEPFCEHRGRTKTELVKLFKAMLKFEMECACRAFGTHTVVRLAGDLIQLGDWHTKLEEIKMLDKRISDDIRQYRLSQLAQYSSQIAENTEDLVFEIRQIKLILSGGRMINPNKKLNELIARFGTTSYLEQMRLNPERHPKTCKWFRGHPNYKAWLKSPDRNLLHVTAEPGCGKSVLSRCLVEEDLPARRSPESGQSNLDPVVCYFFFKDNDIQRSLVNALGAILYQILSDHREVAADFEDRIDALSDELRRSVVVLWEMFVEVSDHDFFENRTIYCVFDALDECSSTGREKLIELLQDCVQRKKRIRFLVTSRPHEDIIGKFRQGSQEPVKLEGDGTEEKKKLQKEIEIVFQFKVRQMVKSKALSPAVVELLDELLVPKAEGQRTYLWVRLVFELIEKETPQNLLAWKKLLVTLPGSVAGAYDQLLSKVDRDSRGSVLTLLHIIYIAARPLTLSEANFAVQVRAKYDVESIDSLGIDDDSFRSWLRRECGFFITEYEGRLFFIHQTAREFLSGSKRTDTDELMLKGDRVASRTDASISESPVETLTWENSIKNDEDAHRVMLECCFASLLLTFRYPAVQKSAAAVEHAFRKYCLTMARKAADSPRESLDLSPSQFATHGEFNDEDISIRSRSNTDYIQEEKLDVLAKKYEEVAIDINVFFDYSAKEWLQSHFNQAGSFWAEGEANEVEFAPPRRRGTWPSDLWEDDKDDDSDDVDKIHVTTPGKMSPAANGAAIFAAYQSFMNYPKRSVFTSMRNVGFLIRIQRKLRSGNLRDDVLGDNSEAAILVFRRILDIVDKEAGSTDVFNCSPLVWSGLFSHRQLARTLLGWKPGGSYTGLQMAQPGTGCGHSEELEILLFFLSMVAYQPRDLSVALVAIEILRYEQQKLSANPGPEREAYFFDLLLLTKLFVKLPSALEAVADRALRADRYNPSISQWNLRHLERFRS
ncbi:hypothetical protein B0T24DRAFT_698076 [Lasiosphaeria ovina]|uniref:NWD NACHT-NTPase N-terminal domain-containing protein n=1 Tax=Lasiosphaeria ovina TaxID=92902 RepID=A0AAE0KGF4_9PEZI|nr:hypothetical protein B0T24DRAFT_698076 [Lasiosphaeria ovina]